MGVVFDTKDSEVPGAFKFIGKTVSFDMDYFGTRRIFSVVQDTETGRKYKIFMSLGHKSVNDRWKQKGARIIITAMTGQGRISQRVDRWSLNRGYITFDYIQVIGNVGAVMTGYISHDPGKKAYIGYKTMRIRRR